ncbi:MAG: hypothetical protein JWP56_1498, partial [Aeromicrobium sp.]|nr:hypothetical protein [Aeromicrobium sp.]
KRGVAGGIAAVALLGGAGLKTAADLEQSQIGFETMLGSAQKADAFLAQIKRTAANTPFELKGLTQTSQKLLAFGFDAKEIIPTLTTHGDASAGLGRGAAGLDQIATAFGQIKTKGRVQGDEILQLTEAGIPAMQILRNQLGLTATEYDRLQRAGKISADVALPALLKGMNNGTKGLAGETTAFGGLMEKQSKSLSGLASTLKDKVFLGLADGIAPLVPLIKDGLQKAIDNIGPALKTGGENLAAFVQGMKDGTGPGGKLADILGKVWDVLKPVIDFIRNNKAVVATFVGVVITLTAAFAALNLVLAINPFTLVILGIAALAAGFVYAYKHSETFRTIVDGLWNNVLKPFGAWLGEHLPGILRVVGKAFLTAAQFIVHAFNFILTAVLTVFGGILSAAAKAFGWIPGLGDDIKKASKGFNVMKDVALDALDSVEAGLQDAQNGLDKLGKKNPKPKITPPASGPSVRAAERIAESLNKLDKVHAKPTVSLGGVGSVLNSLANLGAGLDAAIRKSSKLSRTRIGENAKGTDNWRGGLTWVGEEGPELLNVSKGAQIIPNHKLGTVGRDIAATTTASRPASPASSSTASGPSTMRITHLDPLLRFIEVAVEDGIDGLVAHSEEIAGMSY